MNTMIRTVTVKSRIYTVEDEPRTTGEVAPHLYNSRGECVGVVIEMNGKPWIEGAPSKWTGADIRNALHQIIG